MTRRQLPANCDPSSPTIEMLALLRATDAQWTALERVASNAARVVALRYDGAKVTFAVATRDGRHQTGAIDATGAITRERRARRQARVMSALGAATRDRLDQQVTAVAERGPAALHDALLCTLAALHRIAAARLDAGPAARQVATVALADVRDIGEGGASVDPETDCARCPEGNHAPEHSHHRAVVAQAIDAPWPTDDPLGQTQA